MEHYRTKMTKDIVMETTEDTNNLGLGPKIIAGQCTDTGRQRVLKDVSEPRGCCTSTRMWTRIFTHRALLLVLLAALCAALESIVVRYVAKEVHAMQVSVTRFLIQLLSSFSILTYSGVSPKADSKPVLALLIIRGLVGAFAVATFYYALYFTEVGNATAVLYGSPVFVVFFARIILKDAIGIIDVVLTLVVIVGVTLICQPPFLFGGGDEDASREIIGALLALCACISVAFTVTLTAKMGTLQVNSFKIVFYYGAVATIATALLTTILRVWSIPSCGSVRFALVGIGILSCSHQCLQTYSLSMEKAVNVIIVRTNEVIFAYMLEFFLFDTSPGIVPLIGAGLIMIGSISACLKKLWVSRKKNKSETD